MEFLESLFIGGLELSRKWIGIISSFCLILVLAVTPLISACASEEVKYIVDPDKIVGGGPPKDGIPSIDNPKYVSLEEADQWIEDNELVLGITYKGIKRVYPLQIMVLHEIVNDIIANDPLLITY